MRYVYTFLIHVVWGVLKLFALFNQKLQLFVQGRSTVFQQLRNSIKPSDKTIWMHVASLGEFEQGLPLLDELKSEYKSHKIVLTFFSPSGYEVKKNTDVADVVTYLPMDTAANAKKFLDIVRPALIIFVKYEIWPNYLHYLKQKDIPTFLVSGIFRKNQIFFKAYGGFMRKALQSFSHFFVQNENSAVLLKSIGFTNILVSGDTRFDRVGKILSENTSLSFMEAFKGNELCVVAGSTWPEDEVLLTNFINSSTNKVKYVIAPHDIKPKHIQNLKASIQKETALYSEWDKTANKNTNVLIVDTVGLLTKIYSYGNIAYVGGGFATGLHNTLEPAVFGIPVLIGPQYDGFQEAEDLTRLGGVLAVSNSEEFTTHMNELLNNFEDRQNIGIINSTYITKKIGATTKIMEHINRFL